MSKLLRKYKAFIILIFSFYVINIFAKSVNQNEYRTDSESFAIPGHGELIINVPKIWNYRYKTTNDDKPPIITFYNLDKNKIQNNITIAKVDFQKINISLNIKNFNLALELIEPNIKINNEKIHINQLQFFIKLTPAFSKVYILEEN